MSTVSARKKSVVSTNGGLQIETPVAHNTFLNKSAAQSTSLYQQCSQLRARLLRIYDFAPFFALSSPSETRTSTDPVTQLWDCFALGVPLCYLHNLIPGVTPITIINTDPETVDPRDEKAIKKAILHFAMAIGKTDLYDSTEQFRATQLLDRSSTEGFVKVVNCVARLVERLPEDCFQEAPPLSPPSQYPPHESTDTLINPDSPMLSSPANAQENARNNVIREIVETERKYVQDLEHMQKYANALATTSAIDQDTIHLLFPGLSKLLDFQRRFLIKLEGSAELPWKDQRWGLHFLENENEFNVYEPYCANYTHAMDILLTVEQNLSMVTLINAKSELPAFLIKPVQRICKYPLLLEQLLKASANSDYPHYEELKAGHGSAKRIADRINEAQRRSENQQTVESLESRVEDWKGHHLSNFGELLLDDVFMVMKMDIDREYHVFLFEKIILCCKEVLPTTPGANNRKGGKSNSILKKQQMTFPGAVGPSSRKRTPLLLKGRIFLNNVTHTKPFSNANSYSLQVWWKGDDDNEYFTLRCRSEEQLRLWEGQINRLIKETQARRQSERNLSLSAHIHANSTNPLRSRQMYDASRQMSASSVHYLNGVPSSSGPSSTTRRYPPASAVHDDHRPYAGSQTGGAYASANGAGPSGYPQDDDYEGDEDYEEYPPSGQYSVSGRGTQGTQRGNASQGTHSDREQHSGYERPRARTEDQNGPVMQQWRKNGQPAPPPVPQGVARPNLPRLSSNMSELSFGNGVGSHRPPLRSQFSSTRLNAGFEDEGAHAVSSMRQAPRSATRSRSASQPSAYHPPQGVAPPLPITNVWSESSTLTSSAEVSKRGSGSSQSTGDSSEYSPHSTSPITPFGSSDSSLAGTAIRAAQPHHGHKGGAHHTNLSTVKVKVHFFDDIFVIQVPRVMEYEELVEKVGRKIRLCGPRRDDGPLRVKYVDEDGDQVSLGSTEDVLMAFETMRPGNQVTLIVS